MTDEFGGVAVEAPPATDEFGGVAVQTDEFGGIPVTTTATMPAPSAADFAESNRAQMGNLDAPALPDSSVTPPKIGEQEALARALRPKVLPPDRQIAPAPNTPASPGGISEPIGSAFAGLLPRPSVETAVGPIGKGIAGAISGTEDLIEGVAQYLTSPQGLVELGLTKTPLAPAVMVKWAKDMVEGGLINAGEAKVAWNRGDMAAFGKHVAVGAGMLFGAGGIIHKSVAAPVSDFARGSARLGEANLKALEATMPPALKELAPATARATAETIATTEDINARTITSPTQVSELGVRTRMGEETPLRQPGEVAAAKTLTPATDAAVAESKPDVHGGAEADLPEAQRLQSQKNNAGMVAAMKAELGAMNAPKPVVQETLTTETPTSEPAKATDWNKLYEDLSDNLDSFSPARDTGRTNYELEDMAQRFVDYAKADTSGKPLTDLVKDFAKQDEASASQIKKLKAALKDVAPDETSPPPPPRPAEAMGKSAKPRTPLQQLDAFVAEHGMEQGWVTNPDAFYAEIGKGGDTVSLKGKFAKNKAVQAARQNAIRDLQLKPSDSTLPKYVLPKLQALIAEKAKAAESVKLKAGQNQGEFPAEDLTLRSESGVDAERIAAEKAQREADAKAAKDFETENQMEFTGDISDWTSATEDAPATSESAIKIPPEDSGITYRHAGIPLPKFENRKMSPLDRVTALHSGKIQKSMSEARRAQKEIKKAVPKERRQAAISIWREANGDIPTLQSWAGAAKGKAFKQAAIDAQNLTPPEIAIARKTIAAFDVLEKRGNRFDVLKSHRDNYVPHVWDIKKPGSGFGTGMLKQRFKFSKARTFNTFFEGDQAGFKPKTLAIGKLLPAYIHEMNTVIANRQFVRDLVSGEAKDGSPLAVPRGNVKVVDGSEGKAVLVQPKSMRETDTSDYRMMPDQPALSSWTWEGKDTDGKPVFVKADLALHPEAYRRVQAMLGQSAIRAWYNDPVGGTAQIPREIVRGLDTAQSAMKREMFGLLAPFHQVQEGTHAIGHTVNPFFGLEKIDLSRNPEQLDAANHGLMLLPDQASSSTYMEGVGTRASLLSRGIRKIPKAGEAIADVIDGYQDYLFHQYIPSLKFKTYEAMVKRNTKLYTDELASGKMTPADVKITSAEQANAAYGHLNYALLDRNPTIQHLLQVVALAPDFLEARVRFAGQGVKGLSSKVGYEQFRALALLATAQAGTAFVLSQVLGVPYDKEHPFEVVYKGRRYAMRSVPEDIFSLIKDTRQFAYARVNPLTVKGGIQLATGLNYRGEKVTALDTMEELLAGYIPITARQLPGLRSLTETSRNTPITPLQQLAGSLGLRISRYSPISETYKLASDWKDAQKLPKDSGSYPVSKYQQLRYALEDGDMDRAKAQYDELLKTMPAHKISTGFAESINHPFTGNKANDAKFYASLKGYDKEMYDLAIRTRQNILKAFRMMPKASKNP